MTSPIPHVKTIREFVAALEKAKVDEQANGGTPSLGAHRSGESQSLRSSREIGLARAPLTGAKIHFLL